MFMYAKFGQGEVTAVLSENSKHCQTSPVAATSSNSRGGLSFAHLFSGSIQDRETIILKTMSFIIHNISYFSMFPMALGSK